MKKRPRTDLLDEREMDMEEIEAQTGGMGKGEVACQGRFRRAGVELTFGFMASSSARRLEKQSIHGIYTLHFRCENYGILVLTSGD